MGITSLFHLIVFTHHIMSFPSSGMSVSFMKNKGGNGREREGWPLKMGWMPSSLLQAPGSSSRAVQAMLWLVQIVAVRAWWPRSSLNGCGFWGPVTGLWCLRFSVSSGGRSSMSCAVKILHLSRKYLTLWVRAAGNIPLVCANAQGFSNAGGFPGCPPAWGWAESGPQGEWDPL